MNYTKNVRLTLPLRKGDTLQTKILELRKNKKVTQSELADAVNVTRQTIISLENGKYKASLILAHKIAQFFNVSIEDIFIFDEEGENIWKDYSAEPKHATMKNTKIL